MKTHQLSIPLLICLVGTLIPVLATTVATEPKALITVGSMMATIVLLFYKMQVVVDHQNIIISFGIGLITDG